MKEYYYQNSPVDLVIEFERNGTNYCVVDDGDWFIVCSKDSLKKKEDTYAYKMAQEREAKINALKMQEDKIVKRIRQKALDSLIHRLKLSAVFTKDATTTQVGLMVATELEKLIESNPIEP